MNVFGYRLPLFSSLVIWAILWEIIGHTDAKLILPPLSAITLRIFEIVPTKAFLQALIITGKAFFIGSFISILIGIPLGVLMGRSKIADDLLLPWVNVFLSAPLSALVPVIMVIAGIGETTMILGLPLWPGPALMVPGFLLLSLAGLYRCALHLRRARRGGLG